MSDVLQGSSRRVSAASLVVFRIGFGLLMAGEAYRLVSLHHARRLWVDPGVRLAWPGLRGLPVADDASAYVALYALVVLGALVAAGAGFRVACVLLALGWAWLLASAPTAFLHGPYLGAWLALLLAGTPANVSLSVDAWLRPRVRSEQVPAWSTWLLRAQLAIALTWAGLWMLDGDWLRGYPLRLWLPERAGMPLLGWVHESPAFAVAASWGLLALFLLAAPGLAWRRTRPVALAGLLVSQLWSQQTFDFGVLPWLVLLGATAFLPPDWPRRVVHWPVWPTQAEAGSRAAQAWVPRVAAVALALQAALPLLAVARPGPTRWNGAGDAFCWRWMHETRTGALHLAVTLGGSQARFDPSEELTQHQYRRISTHPGLLRAYARHVAERSGPGTTVRAFTLVSLNGREPQRLLDTEVDLAADVEVEVLPLRIPLERQWPDAEDWPPPRDEL